MARFEDFRPRLKPCALHTEGAKLVLEENGTQRLYMLPLNARPIVELLDGQHSIQQIITELHTRQSGFRFHDLFRTIQSLRDLEFLEPDPEAGGLAQVLTQGARPGLLDRAQAALTRLRFQRVFRPSLQSKFRSVRGMIATSVTLVVLALWSLLTDDYLRIPNEFASYRGSHAWGLVVLAASAMILMSLKGLVQLGLQLLATGRVYGVGLRWSHFSFHFSVTDSAIYLTPGRKLPFFFHLGSLATVLAITGILEVFLGSFRWYSDVKTVAFFLTILDLNPYQLSDISKLFRLWQGDELAEHALAYSRARIVLPSFVTKERVQNEFKLALLASFALAWSAGALYFNLTVLEMNYPNLWLSWMGLTTDPTGALDSMGAAFALFLLAGVTAYFFFGLITTLCRNLYVPIAAPVNEAVNRILVRNRGRLPPQIIRDLLLTNPLFAEMAETSLEYLCKTAWVRSYPKGTRLVTQGSKNQALFAILEGEAEVRKRQPTGVVAPVATLGPRSSFGELSVIYGRDSTADVVAKTPIRAVVIHKNHIKNLAHLEKGQVDYERMVSRVMLSHFLANSSLFGELPAEVIHLFTNEGKRVSVPAGETVTEQGSLDKTFFLVVHGSVEIIVDGQKVRDVHQGDFFGEIALIADIPRTATVRTLTECAFLKIESEAFWRTLSSNIHLALLIEHVADIRVDENRARQAS